MCVWPRVSIFIDIRVRNVNRRLQTTVIGHIHASRNRSKLGWVIGRMTMPVLRRETRCQFHCIVEWFSFCRPLKARSRFFLHFGAVNNFFLLTYLKLVGTDAKCLPARGDGDGMVIYYYYYYIIIIIIIMYIICGACVPWSTTELCVSRQRYCKAWWRSSKEVFDRRTEVAPRSQEALRKDAQNTLPATNQRNEN